MYVLIRNPALNGIFFMKHRNTLAKTMLHSSFLEKYLFVLKTTQYKIVLMH